MVTVFPLVLSLPLVKVSVPATDKSVNNLAPALLFKVTATAPNKPVVEMSCIAVPLKTMEPEPEAIPKVSEEVCTKFPLMFNVAPVAVASVTNSFPPVTYRLFVVKVQAAVPVAVVRANLPPCINTSPLTIKPLALLPLLKKI